MKRAYNSPEMHWVPVCSNSAVADVCWAYANNVKPFYYNTYGRGYAELYAMGGSCDKDVYFEIRYYPSNLSEAEKAIARADMEKVIARVTAEMPNKPTNYKGSGFSTGVGSDWS